MQGLTDRTREDFFELPIEERYRWGDAYNAATRVVVAITNVDGTSHGIVEREPDNVNKAFALTTAISRDHGGFADIQRHAILEMADNLSTGYFLNGEPEEKMDVNDAAGFVEFYGQALYDCLDECCEV